MYEFHSYQPSAGHGLKHDPFNAVVGPRPIGWISTVDEHGVANLAPYSFFNAFNYRPPIIGFSSIGWKDTVRNIAATGEFVWNLATRALAEPMNQTSLAAPPEIDEFQLAGIERVPSSLVRPARVALSPVSFECRMTQQIQLKTAEGKEVESWLTLGEVVMAHIARDFIVDGVYATALPVPILRAGGGGDYYAIQQQAYFEMKRPD